MRNFAFFLIVYFTATTAVCQQLSHPLQPADRSSPHATVKTFLETGDSLGTFLADAAYLSSPSREKFQQIVAQSQTALESLDLSELPPVARTKAGRGAALALYEILNRIELPPENASPVGDGLNEPSTTDLTRWVIPHTDIALVRVESGPRMGEYVFSSDTVYRAEDLFEKVRHLPYRRQIPHENLYTMVSEGGGWLIPYSMIESAPEWLRKTVLDQAVWKWIGLLLVVCLLVLFLRLSVRLSRRISNDAQRHPFILACAQLLLPGSVLAATPICAYLLLVQINFVGTPGAMTQIAANTIEFLAAAWILWRIAPVLAEAVISSPRIAPESIDAHLIRVAMRLLGIAASATVVTVGASRLGIPIYGIIAGLGVGGVAIALAAQPSIENLIGGFSLFADKPVRVGEFCRYGTELGTVENIGIRSTRIRGLDRTLTTIPNAALARIPITNLTQRDLILFQSDIRLRYDSTAEQLQSILLQIRELLAVHPRVKEEASRARFVGLRASSMDIEIFAYVTTSIWTEFLTIREELLFRIVDIVAKNGARFALPSQTLYLERDANGDENEAGLSRPH